MSMEAAESEFSSATFFSRSVFPHRVSVFVYSRPAQVNDGVSLNALFQASRLLITHSLLALFKIDARLLHCYLFNSWYVNNINSEGLPLSQRSSTLRHHHGLEATKAPARAASPSPEFSTIVAHQRGNLESVMFIGGGSRVGAD